MPNILVHVGVQTPVIRLVFRRVSPIYIYAGVLIPDLPWIGARVLRSISLAWPNPYDLRLYLTVQSSLFAGLFLAFALSLVSRRPRATFAAIALGCAIHLLLDATQTKWGNGVLLFAPFSWKLLRFDLFWPESFASVVLAFVGMLVVSWSILRGAGRWEHDFAVPPARRLSLAFLAVCVYCLGPLGLLNEAERADVHFVATLRASDARSDKYVELDRAKTFVPVEAPGEMHVITFSGESISLAGVAIRKNGTASIQGHFVNSDVIQVSEIHYHWPLYRDLASIAGVAGILAVLAVSMFRHRRRTRYQ